MDDDWKSLINETTDEIKKLPAEKSARKKEFAEILAQVKNIFDNVIIPTLNELKIELDRHNTPASVSSSENFISDRVRRRTSVSVNLSNLLRDANTDKTSSTLYPKFFYEICIEASVYGAAVHIKCYVEDTRGQIHDLRHAKNSPLDLIEVMSGAIADLTSDNIKQDFGLKYKDSVGSLRSSHVYE